MLVKYTIILLILVSHHQKLTITSKIYNHSKCHQTKSLKNENKIIIPKVEVEQWQDLLQSWPHAMQFVVLVLKSLQKNIMSQPHMVILIC